MAGKSSWERARKWVRRKPAIAALSAAVFLVGIFGLSGVFWQWSVAVENAKTARAKEEEAIAAQAEVSKGNVALKAALDEAERQRNEVGKANSGLKVARDEVERQRNEVGKSQHRPEGSFESQSMSGTFMTHHHQPGPYASGDTQWVSNGSFWKIPRRSSFEDLNRYHLKRLYYPGASHP